MFYVYILKCNDGSYYTGHTYTGHTENLETRLAQHKQAYFSECYTAKRLPVTIEYQATFESREQALNIEKQVKGWSRSKKKALIRDDWLEISRLSKQR